MGRCIAVFGTGYLGATHAACMAELGHEVLGVDVDAGKVAKLGAGEAPFSSQVSMKFLRATSTRAGCGSLRRTKRPLSLRMCTSLRLQRHRSKESSRRI